MYEMQKCMECMIRKSVDSVEGAGGEHLIHEILMLFVLSVASLDKEPSSSMMKFCLCEQCFSKTPWPSLGSLG